MGVMGVLVDIDTLPEEVRDRVLRLIDATGVASMQVEPVVPEMTPEQVADWEDWLTQCPPDPPEDLDGPWFEAPPTQADLVAALSAGATGPSLGRLLERLPAAVDGEPEFTLHPDPARALTSQDDDTEACADGSTGPRDDDAGDDAGHPDHPDAGHTYQAPPSTPWD